VRGVAGATLFASIEADMFQWAGRTRTALVTTALLLLAPAAAAAPLRSHPVTLKQPDGTVLRCYVSGDEYYNWIHDAAGFTVIPDPITGYYTYAVLDDGVPRASPHVVGRADPAAVGLQPHVLPRPDRVPRMQDVFPRPETAVQGQPLAAPKVGTINNLVVFIRFADESNFPAPITVYSGAFNSGQAGANSLANYYREVSYNQLSIDSTFYPTQNQPYTVSYQDSHPRGYYQPYNAVTNPDGYTGGDDGTMRRDREHALLAAALNAIAWQVPPTLQLDGDGDGDVDNVCFVVRGQPTGWSSLLWPHMWALYTQDVRLNGKRADTYNFQLESAFDVGVLCHEMFHSIGAPDLYHYVIDGINPVYTWDLMEYDLNPPQHMSAYMKHRYGGWIAAIPTISRSGTYSLNPLTSATGNAYRINSPFSASEYFVVEFRKRTGTFESSLPGEGILVYRINPAVYGNADGPPDEVYLYRPGGTPTTNGSPASANFNAAVGRTGINDGTSPSSFLTGGGPGGLSLSGISAVGETMTFNVAAGPQLTFVTDADALSLVKGGTAAFQVKLSAQPEEAVTAAVGRAAGNTNISVLSGSSLAFTTANWSTYQTVTLTSAAAGTDGGAALIRVSAPGMSNKDLTVLETAGKLAPENGASGLGNSVTLTWTALADAGYWVCWDTTDNNTCDGAWWPNGGGAGRALSGLVPGTYYWQVRAQTASGTADADGGAWWSFSVGAAPLPGAFGKASPANGTTGLGTAVTLTWGTSSGATAYQVCVDTTDDSACGTAWQSTGAATTFALSGLENGLHYWQVRAQNAAGIADADGGAWWAFRIGPAPPAFLKLSPADGASGLGSSVTLTWTALADAGYSVCWDTTNNSTCDTAWWPNGGGTARALTGLASGTYYWQVRAQTAAGVADADNGTWFAFTAGAATPPGAFGKVSPTNGTSDLGASPTLTWGASTGATGYAVCYDTTNDNVCGAAWMSAGASTSSALSGLAPGTYYWQVRAQNANGTTDADGGTWWAFTVASAPPPGAFGKVSPTNGTTGLGASPTLTWGASPGATSYLVCHDTTDDNACGASWVSAGAATASALSGLAPGTYYWQARAQNANGTTDADGGAWWAFRVGSVQPTFTKVTPVNGASGLGPSVTLTWTALADAGYWVCWDTTDNSACDGAWWPNGGGAGRALSGLPNGTYYWQVRAATPAGTIDADGGTWFAFTVGGPPQPPGAFGKSAPANAASGLPGALTLSWGASANAASYEVCVDATDDGACGSTWLPAGAATTLAKSGLAAGTYYWQVRAVNATGTTDADGGAWWAFSVVAKPPLFGKLTPANGVSGLGSPVTLTWSSMADAGYWVCWDTTNNNACDGAWWPNGGGAGRTLTDLPNGTYYWQVRASTPSGTFDADDGTWFAFTVGGPPQPPGAFGKTSPANGVSGLAGSLTLSWGASASASSYEVCVDTTNDGACSTTWQSAGALASFGLSGLAAGTYYWQVRAVNVTGATYADGGVWWSFAVSATPPLFSKLAPANGAADLGSSVTLQWSPVADAGYYVCWDTTNNNSCDSGWWPNGGVSARSLTGLPAGTYYWQVRAVRSTGSTDADNGTWWTFTVR
jgi:M6 family metalloprotease-like protein